MSTMQTRITADAPDTILNLPDELLLHIAHSIDGNDVSETLRQVALTHSRFRPIAQEVLVRSGVVFVAKIPEYIRQLFKHPKWAQQIRKINLIQGRALYFSPETRVSREAFDEAYALVRARWPDVQGDDPLRLRGFWDPSRWAIALFGVLESLKEISVMSTHKAWSMRYLCMVLGTPTPSSHVSGVAISRLTTMIRGRLESLSVITADYRALARVHGDSYRLPLQHLDNLKVLTLWVSVLPGTPFTTFPPSLEVLKIHCDQHSAPWYYLRELHQYTAKAAAANLPRLREVQLLVGLSCRDFAWDVVYTEDYVQSPPVKPKRSEISQILVDWQNGGTPLKTYFLDRKESGKIVPDPRQYKQGDLLKEMAWFEEQRQE